MCESDGESMSVGIKSQSDTTRMKGLYEKMLLIRLFEDQAIEMYKEGLIGGSYHAYVGQEAVAVGICSALRIDDQITNTYRGRGQHIAKGSEPKLLYSEILGRSTGYCKGKGGPMHITDMKHGILGTNGIVGAGIPIATGAALTAKMTNTDRVVVTFFGDGAINQGVFYESINLAQVWELPIIFVCENNLYQEMTPIRETVKNENLIDRAAGVCMPTILVDGNNVEAVYEAAVEAVNRARSGQGPTFIEAKTYRLYGHMFGDSETYRSSEEVQGWWEKEPIKRLREKMISQGIAKPGYFDQLEKDLRNQIAAAAEYARQSPEAQLDELYTDIV